MVFSRTYRAVSPCHIITHGAHSHLSREGTFTFRQGRNLRSAYSRALTCSMTAAKKSLENVTISFQWTWSSLPTRLWMKPFKIVKPKTLVKLVPKSAPDVHDKNLRPICLWSLWRGSQAHEPPGWAGKHWLFYGKSVASVGKGCLGIERSWGEVQGCKATAWAK